MGFILGALGEPRAQSRAAIVDDAWTRDVTSLTMAPDGAWGAATAAYVNTAIAGAVADCKARTEAKFGCGAHLTTIRAGWSLGLRCGASHVIVVADHELATAELTAQRREQDLRANYAPEMPSCTRVVTVDPNGRVVLPKNDGVGDRFSRK
jgi:hypothetical protein